nr:hypothetical protein [Lachnospiraceae bacterium]
MPKPENLITSYDQNDIEYINNYILGDIQEFVSTIHSEVSNNDIEHFDDLSMIEMDLYKSAPELPFDPGHGNFPKLIRDDEKANEKNMLQAASDSFKKKIENFVDTGDDSLEETIKALTISPINRVLDGWGSSKTALRLNLVKYMRIPNTTKQVNLLSEQFRETLRVFGNEYPIYKLSVDMNNAVDKHIKYFKKADAGTLTAKDYDDLRNEILKEEEKILSDLNRMESVVPGSPEAEKFDKYMADGNNTKTVRRYHPRGTGMLFADTEARVAGLKNNWPIEDLEALAGLKTSMENIYRQANYDQDGKRLASPNYRPGERDLHTRMAELWDEISNNPLRNLADRKEKLNQIEALVREAITKDFVPCEKVYPSQEEDPHKSELEMNNSLYYVSRAQNRKLNQIEIDRLNRVPQQIVQANPEQPVILEVAPVLNNVAKIINEPQKKLSDEDIVKLDSTNVKNRWFIDTNLKTLTNQANFATGNLSPENPEFIQNSMMRYFLANDPDRNSLNDVLELNLENNKSRLDKMAEYLNYCNAHPVGNLLPTKQQAANAAHFGNIDKLAIDKLLKQPLPEMNLSTIDGIKTLTDPNSSEFGRLNSFLNDFLKNAGHFTAENDPDGYKRTAYMSAFGGPKAFHDICGKAKLVNSLSKLAKVVTDENKPAYIRAIAKRYLEGYVNELKDKPLESINPLQQMQIGLTADSLNSLALDGAYRKSLNLPKYDRIMDYIEGHGDYPFDENFSNKLKSKINSSISERSLNTSDDLSSRLSGAPFNKVYELSFIGIKGDKELDYIRDIRSLSEEEKEKADRIFNITFGDILGDTSRQSSQGQGYEYIRINGVTADTFVKNKYNDRWIHLDEQQREFLIRAELLNAVANKNTALTISRPCFNQEMEVCNTEYKEVPKAHFTFAQSNTPVENAQDRYDQEVDTLIDNAYKIADMMPDIKPKLQPKPEGEENEYDRNTREYNNQQIIEKAEIHKNQINGMSEWLKKDYLKSQLEKSAESNAYQGFLKESFLNNYKTVLEEFNKSENPAIKSFGKLKQTQLSNLTNKTFENPEHPFNILCSLTDKLHIAQKGSTDELTPEVVFDVLMGEENYTTFDICNAALKYSAFSDMTKNYSENMKKYALRQNIEGKEQYNPYQDPRMKIYDTTVGLSIALVNMKESVNDGARHDVLRDLFDDKEGFDRFVNGNNNIDTLIADADGKRKALINGWPPSDIDFISSIYYKKALIGRALINMPAGSEARISYEGAYKALSEIADTLDKSKIHSKEDRKNIFDLIDSYGPAFFNDTIARMGQPDKGQLSALKDQFEALKNARLEDEIFLKEVELERFNKIIAKKNTEKNIDPEQLSPDKSQLIPKAVYDQYIEPEYVYDKNKSYLSLSEYTDKRHEGYMDDKNWVKVVKNNASDHIRNNGLFNSFRTWYLAQDDSGTFEEATKKLTEATPEEKDNLKKRFLKDTRKYYYTSKNTPLNEVNIRYYAQLHKKALSKLFDQPLTGIDTKDVSQLSNISNYMGLLGDMAGFSKDFKDNVLFNTFEQGSDYNRNAYISEIGFNDYGKLTRNLDVLENIVKIAKAADPSSATKVQENQNLYHAIAKHYLEEINNKIAGRKISELSLDDIARIDKTAKYLTSLVSIPTEGCPSDDKINAYLYGQIESPFSEEYLNRVETDLRFGVTGLLEDPTRQISTDKLLDRGILKPNISYALDYVKIIPLKNDANKDLVKDLQAQKPDYTKFDEKMRSNTDNAFISAFEYPASDSLLTELKGDHLLDAFRIDGKKVSEILVENGYDDNKLKKGTPEWETAVKAELLMALSDRNRTVTKVPYVYDKDGNVIEGLPIVLKKLDPIKVDAKDKILPRKLVDNPAIKLYMPAQKIACWNVSIRAHSNDPVFSQNDDIHTKYFKDPLNGINLFNSIMPTDYKPIDLKGTNDDGTLSEDGKKYVNELKTLYNKIRTTGMKEAQKLDETDPQHAEIIRFISDLYRTENNETAFDLYSNFTFFNIMGQIGALGMGPDSNNNNNGKALMADHSKIVSGYPAEKPLIPMFELFQSTRRMAITQISNNRLQSKNGHLTKNVDKLYRKMLLSEIDSLDRDLRKIDRLVELQNIKGSDIANKLNDIEKKCMDNGIEHLSKYYARGTGTIRPDIKAKRTMLANGWPVKDLNYISSLYLLLYGVNTKINKLAQKGINSDNREELRNLSQTKNALEQVCSQLENHPIRNNEDRMKMLNMIKAYSDDIYNKYSTLDQTMLADNIRVLNEAINRKPVEAEFLSEADLLEAKADYEKYLEWDKNPTLKKEAVNGPKTPEEKALINPAYITEITEAYQALDADMKAGKTGSAMNTYIQSIEKFYNDNTLDEPENFLKRNDLVETIAKQTKALSNAINEEIKSLNGNNPVKDADKPKLEQMEKASQALSSIISQYDGRVAFENQRRFEFVSLSASGDYKPLPDIDISAPVAAENVIEAVQAAEEPDAAALLNAELAKNNVPRDSFSYIINEQNNKLKNARTEFNNAIKNSSTDLDTRRELEIKMFREENIFHNMVQTAYKYYDLPGKENDINHFVHNAESYKIQKLANSIEKLRPETKQSLLNSISSYKAPSDLELDKQLDHPLNSRVNELKSDVNSLNALSAEERKEYQSALDYADNNVTRLKDNAFNYYAGKNLETLEETAENYRKEKNQEALDKEKDENFRIVLRDMDQTDFIEAGPVSIQKDAMNRVINTKLDISPDHLNNVVAMLKKMDALKMKPLVGERDAKDYAFSEVIAAKSELMKAIGSGNPKNIIEKKKIFEEKRNGMNALFEIAKNFNNKSLTGKMSSTGSRDVPFEYSKNTELTSHINGIFNLYSYIKESGSSIDDFANNPTQFYRNQTDKIKQQYRNSELYKGKTTGEIAGILTTPNRDDKTIVENSQKASTFSFMRGFEALVQSDPDEDKRIKNNLNLEILNNRHESIRNFHMKNNNAFDDPKRRKEVLQLISINGFDNSDMNRLFEKVYLNQNSLPEKKATVGSYIKSVKSKEEAFDYRAIADLTENILKDALKVENTKFDAVEFMENRQMALSKLLQENILDQGKAGYDLLENELLNMEQFYESLREANPDLKMPALTAAQKEGFKQRAEKFKTNIKKKTAGLKREEKAQIKNQKKNLKDLNTLLDGKMKEKDTKLANTEKQYIDTYNELLKNRSTLVKKTRNRDDKEFKKAYKIQTDKLINVGRLYKEWLFEQALNGEISEEYCLNRLKEIDYTDDRAQEKNARPLKASKLKNVSYSVKTHMDRLKLDRNRRRVLGIRVKPDPIKFAEKTGMRNEVNTDRGVVYDNIIIFNDENKKCWTRTKNNPNPVLLEFLNKTKDNPSPSHQYIYDSLNKVFALQQNLQDKSPKELELAYNKLKNAFDEKHIRSIVPRLEGRFTIELLRNTVNSLSNKAFNALSVNNVSFHQRFKPLKDVIEESSHPSPVYVREYNIIQAQNAIANNAENNRAEAE